MTLQLYLQLKVAVLLQSYVDQIHVIIVAHISRTNLCATMQGPWRWHSLEIMHEPFS